MKIFSYQLKKDRLSLIIWSCILSFMLAVCILIYPEMKTQMNEISDMFANMGAFSDAFGMDKINFGEFIGYFGIECGNTLGLGGALFASLLGISALAKEEQTKTADFLLTHPVTRNRVISEKLLSAIFQNVILFLSVALCCTISTIIIGEKISLNFYLILISFLIMQIEITCITFGISAFLSKGGMGIGIGISIGLYFVNIFSNLMEETKFLKYITPFSYTDSGYITENSCLDFKYIATGLVIAVVVLVLGVVRYNKKDIT